MWVKNVTLFPDGLFDYMLGDRFCNDITNIAVRNLLRKLLILGSVYHLNNMD